MLSPSVILDFSFLDQMGLGSKIRDYIHAVGWDNLFESKDDVYVELCLEFFSSFTVQKEALGKEPDLVAIEAVQFRLCGMWFKISLSQLGALLRFVESNSEPAVFGYPTEWPVEVAYLKLAGGTAPHHPKAHQLRDPSLRFIHRLLAINLSGKRSDADQC